jgi:hypothetical protein
MKACSRSRPVCSIGFGSSFTPRLSIAGWRAIWEAVGAANRYIDEQAPWALRKTDPARMNTVALCLGRGDPPRRDPGAGR